MYTSVLFLEKLLTFKIKGDNQLIESLFHFIILQLQGTSTFQNSKMHFLLSLHHCKIIIYKASE